MLFRLTIVLFFLSSCSGGGGGSSNEVVPVSNNPNTQDSGHQCQSFNGSTYDRTYICEFKHKGLDRYYYIQLGHPEADGQSSILFNLHGYGSNALAQMQYADFRGLAYTKDNNFILIHPQGAPLNTALANSVSHWNSGGWTIGSTVDDVDFIDTIIELVSEKYNINQNRIYSTGMSNGGFMSYHLACNLGSKIAAVASVTGSMSYGTYDNCNPSHPTAILQIHGAIDGVVPYQGNSALRMKSIDDVIDYWSTYNSCDTDPLISITDYFNIGVGLEHRTYSKCINNVQVELYKVDIMGHTWPQNQTFGISASDTIWEFINRYDINGRID